MTNNGTDLNPALIASIVSSVLPLLMGNTNYLGLGGFAQGYAAEGRSAAGRSFFRPDRPA